MNVTSTTSTASRSSGRGTGVITGFEDFLRLLTAQLQHQDPLGPIDADRFTQQLAEFAAVEQATRANDRLERLIDTVAAGQLLVAAGYVGRQVELAGDELYLGQDGVAEVSYRLLRDAASAELVIRDGAGKVVRRLAIPTEAGVHRVQWDGRNAAGSAVPSGTYRVEVAAKDGAGDPVPADLRTAGTVEAVALEGNTLLLTVGGLRVPATSVTAVRAATTAS